MSQSPSLLAVGAVAAALVIVDLCAGQTPAASTSGPEAEAAKKFQLYAKQQAANYNIHAESADGRPLKLGEEPLQNLARPARHPERCRRDWRYAI